MLLMQRIFDSCRPNLVLRHANYFLFHGHPILQRKGGRRERLVNQDRFCKGHIFCDIIQAFYNENLDEASIHEGFGHPRRYNLQYG